MALRAPGGHSLRECRGANKEFRPFAEWPGGAGWYSPLCRCHRKLAYCYVRAFGECPGYLIGGYECPPRATQPGVLVAALTE